jgi:beta-lactamase regulating signal transducer with metallopeptidase domain
MLKFKYIKFLLLISTVYSLESTTNNINNTTNTTTNANLFRNEKYIPHLQTLSTYTDSIMIFLIILFVLLLINVLIYKLYLKKKISSDSHSITISTI